jgi:hypothetical protein
MRCEITTLSRQPLTQSLAHHAARLIWMPLVMVRL